MPDNQNSSELVERLRSFPAVALVREAADEIERLRGEITAFSEEMFRVKEAFIPKSAPAMLNGVEGLVEKLAAVKDKFPAGSAERKAVWSAIAALRAADNRDAAEVVLSNDGTSEAQFIADGENLNCPRCGGSGHVGDTPTAAPAGEAVAWDVFDDRGQLIAGRVSEEDADRITGSYEWSGSTKRALYYTHPPAAEVREVDDAMVERVTKAIFEDQCPLDKWNEPMDEPERESWRECARLAIAALSPPGRAEGDV